MADDDRGPELGIITALFLGLSTVMIGLRCYVRIFMLKAFRTEDWLAVATLACFIIYATSVVLSVESGAGRHLLTVPPDSVADALKFRWVGELTYVVTSLFLKFTIGVFLLRICSKKWHTITIWAVLITCLVFNFIYAFIAAFQCRPVQYYWLRYPDVIDGTCLSEQTILGSTYAASAINACADWILGLIPIVLVWNLDITKKAKFTVASILALGSIASTATIVRIPYVWQLAHDGDFLYEFTDLAIWSTVEIGLGLTASSFATLRPLARHFLGHPPPDVLRQPSYHPSLKRGSGTLLFHCRGQSGDSHTYRYSGSLPSPLPGHMSLESV
ncbi:hypothetical protein F5X96DRAFT_381210 [Biscogniauxia mediterranea]|nr:hypothetical protein F5X96DRAFT_381210 [Biscogniauxia mediterranea]